VPDTALDDVDVAGGMVFGSLQGGDSWSGSGDNRESPIEALESFVLDGLLRPPCLVSFSGGRDSSALLALATTIADRQGLARPIPITARFQAEETHEEEWQRLVIRHLGIGEWIRVELTEELDLLGPAGTRYLSRHGLRYPQNVHFQEPLLERASGGSLLSGAGGDELFESHRWARAAMVLDRSVPIRRSDLLVVGAALSPRVIRSRVYLRGRFDMPSWLRPAGQRRLLRRLHRWLGEDTVRYDAHLEWWRRSRYINHGQRSLELLAEDHGVTFLAPFSEERVMRAMAADGGRVGFASRAEAMHHVFADLLPREIIERESKATFLSPLVGASTRAFADIADATTVLPRELVDPAALRRAWQQEQVDVRSLPALQLCWLSQHRTGDDGADVTT
jgi:asparagine synthase (glutamine-hydrolysing)